MYKKRIKDWAIDKNLKSEKPPGSPRTRHQRDSTQSQSGPGVSSAATDASELSNHVRSSPGPAHDFPYETHPAAGGIVQGEYHTCANTSAPQQPWTSGAQFHSEGSYTNSLAQSGHCSEQPRPSILLGSIRDRFLEASHAITRQDTAVLFEILNPAYEAISSVSEVESTQLLTLVADLFQLLYSRPNHQGMLRQLLGYVFALFPGAGHRNQFLSTNGQVLALLGRSGGYDALVSNGPFDTAGGTDSR
jgi:hypothetical protein